jgi:hypothetical protein
MKKSVKFASTAIAVALSGIWMAPLQAQLPENLRDYALAAQRDKGDVIAPMFNGWIANEDGSTTYVFGFANKNALEIVDIPLGPNNFLEPAQFDGVQPTHFPTYSRGGFVGLQERGVFAVTVPQEMKDTPVVWNLTHAGHTYAIPGHAIHSSYEMSRAPAAFGSLNPAIRFEASGPEATDREGIYASRLTAAVGKPVTLSALIQDRGERDEYELEQDTFALGTEWIMHQGPGNVSFDVAKVTGRERGAAGGESGAASTNGWTEVTTTATFTAPGDYVVRLRVDNFEAPDSQFDNQCCWSNAYVPVTVTP